MSVNTKSSRSTRSLSNMSEAMTGSLLLTSSSKLNDFSSHSSSLSESPSINSATTVPTIPPAACFKPQVQKLTRSKVIFNKNKKLDDSVTKPANVIDLNPKVSLVLSESSNISFPRNNMVTVVSPRKDVTFTKSPKKFSYNTSSKSNTINVISSMP